MVAEFPQRVGHVGISVSKEMRVLWYRIHNRICKTVTGGMRDLYSSIILSLNNHIWF